MGNYIDAGELTYESGEDPKEAIEIAEQLIEKITKTWFYKKDFSKDINGNGHSRLFIPLHAKILTITKVEVSGIELNSDWYTYDESSIHIDQTKYNIETPPNLLAIEGPLFPKGYNNIHVEGTAGYEETPAPIIEAVKLLAQAVLDGDYEKAGVYKSERIGKYSYTQADEKNVYTGITGVDKILAAYMRQKKMITMAP